MYPKRVQVRRGDKTYTYLKLVESYRDQGRIRQRVIVNLGREDVLKASGQLDHLAAAFTRWTRPRPAPAGRSARSFWSATTWTASGSSRP
jgi:hypothetical protein